MKYLGNFFTILLFVSFSFLSYSQNRINFDDDNCYAKLKTPDVFDEVEEKVLVTPATRKTIKTPAEYETVTEKILIQPESKKLIYIPAIYETITESVIDQPESKKIYNVPAVYQTRTEKVLVQEESKRLVVVPAVYETITDKVLIRPESKRFIPVPAVYETVSDRVIAKAASQRFVPIPATYNTVSEQIEIEPATTRLESIPPTFETKEEKVLVRPKHTKWVEKKSEGTCLSADPKDCIVWCLVEIPAEYKIVKTQVNVGCDGSGVANSGCQKEIQVPAKYETRTKRVLANPNSQRVEEIPAEYATVSRMVVKAAAQVKEEIIPAQYQTYEKKVVKTPATTREEIIPAVYKDVVIEELVTPATTREEIIPATYKTVTKRVIKTPATTNEEIIPAEYETITKRNLISPESIDIQEIPAVYSTVVKKVLREQGDMQWKRIVCPRHQTAEMNRELQTALKAAGYNPGPSDNVFGPKTYAAMIQFQKDNGMWQGHLDYPTAAALGLKLLPEAYEGMEGTDGSRFASGSAGNALNSGHGVVMTGKGGLPSGGGSSSVGSNGSGQGSASSGSGGNASNKNNDKPKLNNADAKTTAKTTMSSEEMQMIDEINLMRKDPKGYVKHVEAYINKVQNDPGYSAADKAEEISAARSLIDDLKNTPPLSILRPHEGLHQVGIKHGKDVQSQGMIGHKGNDGSWPWDRVKRDTDLKDGNENLVAGGEGVKESLMILLVDSGIPGYGHRKTLLEPKWDYVGVNKIGEVGGIPNAWIQVFGND